MKNKTNIPNILFFFDFSNPLKQIKMNPFGLKTLLKTCVKTLVKMKILLSKNLVQNNQEMGYLYPHFKSARWQLKRANLPFRSTGQRSHFLPLSLAVDRSWIQRADSLSGRPTRSTGAISREQSSLDGRLSRSTGHQANAGMNTCARRSTAPVDRLLLRSTGSKPVSKFWDLKT